MARKPNAEDVITLEIINDKELFKLFNELQTSVQNRIVINGMKDAAKIIKQEIKRSFQSVKKNKSESGYAAFNKSFAVEPLKQAIGVKVGIKNVEYTVRGRKKATGYISRWIQWGTQERSYKKGVKRSVWKKTKDKSGGHNTGSMDKTNFFYGAVERSMPQAQNISSDAIIKSLENTVEKYNK